MQNLQTKNSEIEKCENYFRILERLPLNGINLLNFYLLAKEIDVDLEIPDILESFDKETEEFQSLAIKILLFEDRKINFKTTKLEKSVYFEIYEILWSSEFLARKKILKILDEHFNETRRLEKDEFFDFIRVSAKFVSLQVFRKMKNYFFSSPDLKRRLHYFDLELIFTEVMNYGYLSELASKIIYLSNIFPKSIKIRKLLKFSNLISGIEIHDRLSDLG